MSDRKLIRLTPEGLARIRAFEASDPKTRGKASTLAHELGISDALFHYHASSARAVRLGSKG